MLITCPSCHAILEPNSTRCPTCMRERSPEEIIEGFQSANRDNESRNKGALRGAIFALLAGACLYGYLHARSLGLRGAKAPSAASRYTEPMTGLERDSSLSPTSHPPAPAKAPAPVKPQPPAPAVEWLLKGTAFDLLSLKPVPSARLIFTDSSSGETYKTQTDAQGRYEIRLPKLTAAGYAVSVSAKGYKGDYLEEGGVPFMSRTRAQREDAAAEAAQSQIIHVPVTLDQESELEFNLALLSHR